MRARAIVVLPLLLALPAAAESGKPVKQSITFSGEPRTYWLYLPSAAPTDEKLPLIVALHGSGRTGEPILTQWKDLADREKIAIVGPNSSDSVHWASPADGPLFLREIVEEVGRRHPIDGRRVYLFGHSAGAVFALQMAALESEYFAAAAIHGGSILPAYFRLFDYATRKIPYALYIGTKDVFFPLEQVRATRDALTERGFPVQYTEMPGHTHNYYGSAKEINPSVWEFFRKNPLPSEPKYIEYR